MGYGVGHRTYHTSVVRGPVTKDIVRKTPDMLDEASLALDDLIGYPKGRNPENTSELVFLFLFLFFIYFPIGVRY